MIHLSRTRLWLLATLMVLAAARTGIPRQSVAAFDQERTRFLFFAVLEGLYEDGVQSAVARRVLEVRSLDAPDAIELGTDPGMFVPGCPVCQPVRDAFLVYADGPRILTWLKGRSAASESGDPRGFGDGLPQEEVRRLLTENRPVRVAALEELVGRYTARHMDRLRLDVHERAELSRQLEAGRELGMSMLEPLNGRTGGAFGASCPSCEGASRCAK